MRKFRLIVLLAPLAGCVSSPVDDAVALRRASQSGICHVHHVSMIKETVPVEYGLPTESPPYKAESARFPFARRFVQGGCVIDGNSPKTAEGFVCPECLDAERRWIATHPNDPWSLRRKSDTRREDR